MSAETLSADRPSIRPLHPPLDPPPRNAASLSELSINQMTTFRWSFLQDVIGYRAAGVESIGIWRPKLAQFGEERGTELIADSGLAVSSLSWGGGFTGANGHSYDEAVDEARDALRLAADLNANCLIMVSGARGGHTLRHARRLLVDGLRELIPYAAEFGVPLALQPMHRMFQLEWTFINTLDDALEVLDELDSPDVQLCFDVYHLWQEPRLLERIPEIAHRTAVVQLSDWRHPVRSDNDRHVPGDGVIPLEEIVGAFRDAGYAGRFEINVWSDRLWAGDQIELLCQCRDRFAGLQDRRRRLKLAGLV